jgi:hypothetical protein
MKQEKKKQPTYQEMVEERMKSRGLRKDRSNVSDQQGLEKDARQGVMVHKINYRNYA